MAESIRILDSQKNHIDSLPLTQEEPFTLETFGNLITAYRNQSKFLIIARVETEIPPKNPTDSPEARHFYYEANSLNKLLFRKFGNNSEYLFRLYALNPLTNTKIVGDVHYFLVDAEKEGLESPTIILQSTAAQALEPRGSANRSQLLNAMKLHSLNENLLQMSPGKADIKNAEIVGPLSEAALAEQALRSVSDGGSTKLSFSGPRLSNESRLISPAVRSLLMEFHTYKLSNNASDVDFDKWVNSKTATLASTTQQVRMNSNQRSLNDDDISLQARNIRSWSAENMMGRNKSNIPDVDRSFATPVPVSAQPGSFSKPSGISPITPSINSQIPAEKYKALFIGTDDDYLNRAAIRMIFSANGLANDSTELFDIPIEALITQGIIKPEMLESIGLTDDEYKLAIELGAIRPENAHSTMEQSSNERIIDPEMLESVGLTDGERKLLVALGDAGPGHKRSIIEQFINEGIIKPELLESIGVAVRRNRISGATPPENAHSTSRSTSGATPREDAISTSRFIIERALKKGLFPQQMLESLGLTYVYDGRNLTLDFGAWPRENARFTRSRSTRLASDTSSPWSSFFRKKQ